MLLPITFLMWRTGMRQQAATNALMDGLEEQLASALEHAELEAERRSVQVRRQEFETRLANTLEMADGEAEVIDVVERAFVSTLPDSPIELLLADNSHAHLSRMAVSSPTGEPPMCGVDSPDHCPAARRAQVQRFTDSEALDACPKLRGREQGACSAVCVPVSIMGRTVGVLHATGEPGVSFDETSIQDLATLANLSGARIGLLRMVADTQLQAATDSLTGLLNRRSLENRVRALRADHTLFSVVIADLDHFKALNDTYGHETGDRALRLVRADAQVERAQPGPALPPRRRGVRDRAAELSRRGRPRRDADVPDPARDRGSQRRVAELHGQLRDRRGSRVRGSRGSDRARRHRAVRSQAHRTQPDRRARHRRQHPGRLRARPARDAVAAAHRPSSRSTSNPATPGRSTSGRSAGTRPVPSTERRQPSSGTAHACAV